MLKFRSLVLVLGLVSVTMMTGCVVGRRSVDLKVPKLDAGQSNGSSATVNEPVDAREFQNKPKNPSTPSVDGDVTKMTTDEQLTMIGRQRNSYGMAMGDVALPEGGSITEKMKQLVSEGLHAEGYELTSKGGDLQVDVEVQEFWGWFSPGFVAIKFEAKLKSRITITRNGKSEELFVSGYGLNKAQVASDPNWQLAYKRAFDDFLANLRTELNGRGF